MNQRWLLIDFDNTMMETEKWALPSLIARFNALYGDQIDHPLTLDEFKRHFHGQGKEILCTNLSQHFNIHVDYATLYHERENHVAAHLDSLPDGVTMAPHIVETLTTLQQAGYGLAFVSNNPVQRAKAAMRNASNKQGDTLGGLLSHYFEATSDRQKPLPDIYLQAMRDIGTDTDHAVAIEDSPTGLRAAKAAGLAIYAYGGFADDKTAHRTQMLSEGAVDWFDDWADLPGLLQNPV